MVPGITPHSWPERGPVALLCRLDSTRWPWVQRWPPGLHAKNLEMSLGKRAFADVKKGSRDGVTILVHLDGL